MKTLLIDYGSGNLRSAAKSLEAANFDLQISNNPNDAKRADVLILPGQGHFRQVMESFLASGFEDALRQHIQAGKPFLGICVGMQILFDSSEESDKPGLGVVPGRVRKFANLEKIANQSHPVPQMQWNQLMPIGDSPLMRDLGGTSFAYFVHSYYAPREVAQHGAVTNYGLDFLSVISRDNVHATQFHPEKSQRVGLKLLENFRTWAEKA